MKNPSIFNHLPALITSRIKRPKPQVCSQNDESKFWRIHVGGLYSSDGEEGKRWVSWTHVLLRSLTQPPPPSFSHAHWLILTKIADWKAAELTAAAPSLSSKTPLNARNDVVCSMLATQLLACSWWSQLMQTLFLLPLTPDDETKQSASSSVVPGLFPPAVAYWQGFTGCFWRPQHCSSSWNNQVPRTCERTSACLPFFFSTFYPLWLPTTWSKCSARHKLAQESVDVTFSLC